MDTKAHAIDLLTEFYLCMRARPKHNAIALQLEKDQCEKIANNLNNLIAWGTDEEIAESCRILEPKLIKLKEKLIFELLQHGI